MIKILTLTQILVLFSVQLLGQWNQEGFTSTNDNLSSIYFANNNYGWLSGSNNNTGILYGTSDGGSSWLKIFFPDAFKLESIFFINENVGWAVGNDGIILVTTDGGRSWFYLDSGSDKNLSKVFFISEYKGWICNEELQDNPAKENFGTILNTTNGGIN